jgi:hypothetical protein
MNAELTPMDGPPLDPPPAGPPPFTAWAPLGAWPPAPPPLAPARRARLRRSGAVLALLGALVAGSAVGGFLIAHGSGADPAADTAAVGGSAPPSPSPGRGFHGRLGIGLLGVGALNLLQDAATYLGISEQALLSDLQGGKSLAQVAGSTPGKSATGLISALVSDATAAIDKALASGRISSRQASQVTSHLTQMITALVDRTGPLPGRPPGVGAAADWGAIEAAAGALGISPAQLRSDLTAGQSVATVASSRKVALSTVESAVVTAVDKQIAGLESSGRLTSTEASALTSQVPQRVDAWATGSFPGWPFGPFGGAPRGAPSGPWRVPPPAAAPSPNPPGSSS